MKAMRKCWLLLVPLLLAWVDPTTGASYASGVLRPYDPPAQNWLPGHRGVDLRLDIGEEVLAAGDGTVAFVGVVAGTPTVSIQHEEIRTTYQPVHGWVSQGEVVREGDVIGKLGHPFDDAPGLHWGARTGKDQYMNPLSLLTPTIRLKPVDELD
ncbi:membrane protein [Corynebacterium ammoniagenes DSM 20306]|nr:membrane protein [Corynebacterium ammoniagenes DSM 20306]